MQLCGGQIRVRVRPGQGAAGLDALLEGKIAEGAGTESGGDQASPGIRLVLGQEGVARLCKVKETVVARGWSQDPGVRSRQPRAG